MNNNNNLKDYAKGVFASDKNAEIIINSVKLKMENVKGLNIDFDGKEFFDIFNSIASSVFTYEIKRLPEKTPGNVLQIIKKINDIVVNEIIKYIMKKTTYEKKEPVSLILSDSANNDKKVKPETKETGVMTENIEGDNKKIEKIKETTSILEIFGGNDEEETLLPENTTSIRLNKALFLKETNDITHFNNTLCINNTVYSINPACYKNIDNILKTVNETIKDSGVKFDLEDKDFVACYSENQLFSIDPFRSTILRILGFSENTVIKNVYKAKGAYCPVIKVNQKVSLSVFIRKEDMENKVEIMKVPLFIHGKDSENDSATVIIDMMGDDLTRVIPYSKDQRTSNTFLSIKVDNYSVKTFDNPCFTVAAKHIEIN